MTLGQYMRRENLTLTALADRLNKPLSTVHGWKSGRRLPQAADLAAIERLTSGEVTSVDFFETENAT